MGTELSCVDLITLASQGTFSWAQEKENSRHFEEQR